MLSAAGPGVRGRTGAGKDLARRTRLGPPPAAPRLSLGFVWLPPGGMGTHRGSGDLPGANVSITRPPGCVATSRPGGAFGRRAVRMASDATRSRFSRMEPAPSLSPAQAPWAGVDAMRSIFGCFPSWEQCRVVPRRADEGVLSRRARGAAPGEGQWIPALPCSLALLRGPSTREPDAVTSQDRTVPSPRAMDHGGGGWGGRRVWKFIRTPFRQTAQH